MWRVIAINALILTVLLVCLEAVLAWLVARDSPTGIRAVDRLAQKIYWANVSYVQYLPECARYDSELGYTLQPGNCVFENTGFSTELGVNSAGFRDDEASLNAPEIVVLGDSQAMGWGVGQGMTFADLIETETGRKTLNTGVIFTTARYLLCRKIPMPDSSLETNGQAAGLGITCPLSLMSFAGISLAARMARMSSTFCKWQT